MPRFSFSDSAFPLQHFPIQHFLIQLFGFSIFRFSISRSEYPVSDLSVSFAPVSDSPVSGFPFRIFLFLYCFFLIFVWIALLACYFYLHLLSSSSLPKSTPNSTKIRTHENSKFKCISISMAHKDVTLPWVKFNQPQDLSAGWPLELA